MEPAALRSEPLGHRAQEGDDVVLRLALDLARALRIDLAGGMRGCAPSRRSGTTPLVAAPRRPGARSAARARAGAARRRSRAARAARSGRSRQARGSTRSSALAACSARKAATRSATAASDSARMRAARCAAFFAPALPMATDGDRHARRHLDDRVERIGAAERPAVERDADHRQSRQARRARPEDGRQVRPHR